VFELAGALLPATAAWPVGEVAVEDWGRVNRRQRLRVAGPGDQLLGCDKVDVGQGKDGVNELEETLLAVGPVEEPGRVEEEGEGGLALGVVLQEVLGEDLLDGVGVFGVEATVRHGAGSAPDILESLHGHFPHAGVGAAGTGGDTARVGHLVLQGVRPRWRSSWHRGVVVEAIPAKNRSMKNTIFILVFL